MDMNWYGALKRAGWTLGVLGSLTILAVACGGTATSPVAVPTQADTPVPSQVAATTTPAVMVAAPQSPEPPPTPTEFPPTPTLQIEKSASQEPASAAPSMEIPDGLADMTLILESQPEVVDLTSKSARVSVLTTIDVGCSGAYGTTLDYGQLATDTDMAGAGHDNHGPLLTGLLPDTVYHFRLGGMDGDGMVYRSEDFEFRTPSAEPESSAIPSGENLALMSSGTRVVGTSSNFGGAQNTQGWGGNKAIDGLANTAWSSDGDGDGAWIEIELALDAHITSLGFWTRTMGASAEIQSFRVVTDRGDVDGPFILENANGVYYFDTDVRGKRLRFEAVDTSGGNTGVVRIEVYGDPLP